ncbi:MAG: hypothetical protein ABSG75_12045 [Syntrophales bacterium]
MEQDQTHQCMYFSEKGERCPKSAENKSTFCKDHQISPKNISVGGGSSGGGLMDKQRFE